MIRWYLHKYPVVMYGATTMNTKQLFRYIQKQHSGLTQAQTARALCVAPQYLNDVLRGRREPGDRLLQALGLRKIVSYGPMDKYTTSET